MWEAINRHTSLLLLDIKNIRYTYVRKMHVCLRLRECMTLWPNLQMHSLASCDPGHLSRYAFLSEHHPLKQ